MEKIIKQIEEAKERIFSLLSNSSNAFDSNNYYKELENYYLNIIKNILSVGHLRKELYGEDNLLNGNNSFTKLDTDLVKVDLGPNANLGKLSEQSITNSAILMEHFKKIKKNYNENSFESDKAIIDTVKLLLSNYALYSYSKNRKSDKYSV